jgi:hypothetical protein
MKLWRKNKRLERELPSFLKAGLSRFNGWLISIANFLQRKTNSYSTGKKKFLLLLFVLVFVTQSGVVIIQSSTRKIKTMPGVNRIKTLTIPPGEKNTPRITKTQFLKIQKFKNYIDSLSRTARGRRLKDSLLQNRPQLMDSVSFLINLFLEQSKTLVK